MLSYANRIRVVSRASQTCSVGEYAGTYRLHNAAKVPRPGFEPKVEIILLLTCSTN